GAGRDRLTQAAMAGAGVRASQATNGKAIAALFAGICGVTIIPVACPPLALALGYQARREIAASHGRQAGRGLAAAGIVLGWAEGATDMPGDGVLITIRWATDFDQWNLSVDDMSTGQTVAQGLDVDSNAQSVLLSRPHNGLYRIRAVPVYTDFDKRDLKYSGSA